MSTLVSTTSIGLVTLDHKKKFYYNISNYLPFGRLIVMGVKQSQRRKMFLMPENEHLHITSCA